MSPHRGVRRRRFLQIAAASAAAVVLPSLAARSMQRQVVRGVVLGAETEMQLYHPDPGTARAAAQECFAEAKRLESIFSLQQADSALSRLNAAGILVNPPQELVRLLEFAAEISRATGGAFDASVQPLWRLYAAHFAKGDAADPAGPSPDALRDALSRVSYREISVARNRIAFGRPGMAVTLNGIAQGFITDRIAEALRERGFRHVLVDMGETRALEGHPGGEPWRIGIADPSLPWRHLDTIDLVEKAVATSGSYGMTFDSAGRHHHLFDPRTGRCPQHYLSVSVVADNATLADALSTALSIMPPDEAQRTVSRYPVRVLVVDAERNFRTLVSPDRSAL